MDLRATQPAYTGLQVFQTLSRGTKLENMAGSSRTKSLGCPVSTPRVFRCGKSLRKRERDAGEKGAATNKREFYRKVFE